MNGIYVDFQAVYYLMVAYFCYFGYDRLRQRVADLVYQDKYEPDLLSFWDYVGCLECDFMFFVPDSCDGGGHSSVHLLSDLGCWFNLSSRSLLCLAVAHRLLGVSAEAFRFTHSCFPL